MCQKKSWLIIMIAIALMPLILSACSGVASASPSPSPSLGGGGAIVQSDSIISGEVKNIRKQTSGYPWEVDVLINSSEDVDSLANPTRDKLGQVITAKADEDLSSFEINQLITAKVKYVGDVPLPGITLYIYDIRKE
jgi:hypothetical protein